MSTKSIYRFLTDCCVKEVILFELTSKLPFQRRHCNQNPKRSEHKALVYFCSFDGLCEKVSRFQGAATFQEISFDSWNANFANQIVPDFYCTVTIT